MRLRHHTALIVVGLITALTPLALWAGPASAGAPAQTEPVALTCNPGTYSYITGIYFFNAKGAQISDPVNLECGGFTGNPYPTLGYPSSQPVPLIGKGAATSYTFSSEWRCANTTDPVGGSVVIGGTIAKGKNPTTIRCSEPASTGGSDIFLTIG
jgi:hypothetical protein